MQVTNGNLPRITKAYIAYHLRRNSKWLPKVVSCETPKHICEFITQKCGPKEKGFEGRKVHPLSPFEQYITTDKFIHNNSTQQLSRRGLLSHSGTALFDLTKVSLNGAMIRRLTSGMYALETLSLCQLGLPFQLRIANKITPSVGIHDGPREDQGKGWRNL
jgi:hypothetical protein